MPTVGPTYVGSTGSSGITGTWVNPTNAEGNTPTTATTWTDATRSSTATWQGTLFGFTSASVPSGGVLNSISITVRHSESSATILSLTGQLYYSGTAVGTAHTITQSTTAVDNTWTVTDLGLYSNLANYQVRVVATRTNTTTSTTQSIFDCSITLTYTATGTDTYSTTVANDQPVAYWRLADVGTTATDATGNGHSGALSATGITTGVAGVISGNAAMTFNGSTGTISVASFPAVGALFSFECWFKIAATTVGIQELIDLAGGNGQLYVDSSGVASYFDGTRVVFDASLTNLCDNNWKHLVVTFNGTIATLYLQGSSAGTTTAAFTALPASTSFLGSNLTPANFLAGTLDEVAIYNYALTSTQVATHYTTGAPAVAQIWQPPLIRVSQAVSQASNW